LAQATAATGSAGDDVRHVGRLPGDQEDWDWARRIDAVVTELKPTPREHADIMIEAGRISRTLKRQLKSEEHEK
jgi:hypothetical protein